ncbi:hypothetical protein GCM10023190_24060 [Enteractinococcus fodinae]|uniref:Flagellar biosynthesis GTPase FlhF n=1 Tax=Enteractinococcus fodinae TaxID=684663 RepID=A0ABU2B616_9MICC|nr:hypothetical protein [Enteractinococcus fodinae]MDR7347829.1 flagellar biosynthesis GTPase FlhF [Enteractinococcus fodinae]
MTTNQESSNNPASGGTRSASATEQAKQTTRQEADRLKGQAQSAADDVADTAKHEAHAVQDEAMDQAKSLASSVQEEANAQASTQQQRLAEQSRTVTDDLQRIRRGERPESDMVLRAVSTVADRAEAFTHQLETKEPRELLSDVRRFASRRPGAFLLIAAGAGLIAGRLTRGMRDAESDQQSSSQSRSGQSQSGQVSPTTPQQPPAVPVRGTETLGIQPDIESGGRL